MRLPDDRITRDSKPPKPVDQGIHDMACDLTQRLISLGLPGTQVFVARDAVVGTLDNFRARLMAGEWEPR